MRPKGRITSNITGPSANFMRKDAGILRKGKNPDAVTAVSAKTLNLPNFLNGIINLSFLGYQCDINLEVGQPTV